MLLSRRLVLALPLSLFARPHLAAAASNAEAAAAIDRFYVTLLTVMKQAKQLHFDGRYNLLAPAIGQTFDLPLMSRLSIGPAWPQIPPEQQQRLTAACSRYTISVYANRFDDYGGEHFAVDPNPVANPNGLLVKTNLVKSDGEKIELNYLTRQDTTGAWKVIDVYLSGTISELATRRAEFQAVVQRDGAEGLVRLLDQRSAGLRTG